jgi:phosphotransferase system HPr-like phosphotransfer protein
MKSKYISIYGITDLANFVSLAKKINGDILVKTKEKCINGKSLLGMMSFDTKKGFIVEYPEEATDFEKFILQLDWRHKI